MSTSVTDLITMLENVSDDPKLGDNNGIDSVVIYSEDSEGTHYSHIGAPIEVRITEYGVQLWVTGDVT